MVKKIVKKKRLSRSVKNRVRRRYHRIRMRTPVEQKWWAWNHDLDTMLHQLVRCDALAKEKPEKVVARAAAFADALHALQEKKREEMGMRSKGWERF